MADYVIKGAYITFFVCVAAVYGEQCGYYDNSWYYSGYSIKYKYCSTGCCGDYYNRYCCAYTTTDTYYYNPLGLVVGLTIGSVVFVIIVVSIIVAICYCRRSRGRRRQILQPATTTPAVIGMQTGAVGYGQPAQGQGRYDQRGYNEAGYNQPRCNQAGYGQGGYANMGFLGQMPTANVTQGAKQKWEEPPPPYETLNPL